MKKKHFLTFHEGGITWYQSLKKTVQGTFRPIFLTNIHVKILRKLLANWIQQCIKRTVHNDQVGFIPVVPGTFNIWKFIHLIHYINKIRASPVAQWVKNLPAMQETQEMQVWSLAWEDPLEEGMATHSSILAWRIPMNGGVWWAMVHRVTKSHDWSDWAYTQGETKSLAIFPFAIISSLVIISLPSIYHRKEKYVQV